MFGLMFCFSYRQQSYTFDSILFVSYLLKLACDMHLSPWPCACVLPPLILHFSQPACCVATTSNHSSATPSSKLWHFFISNSSPSTAPAASSAVSAEIGDNAIFQVCLSPMRRHPKSSSSVTLFLGIRWMNCQPLSLYFWVRMTSLK